MSEVLKRKFQIGVGKETVRGTVATPAIWLKPLTQDIQDKMEVKATERAMGVIEDSDEQVVIKRLSGGKITGEVMDKSIGYFLLGALGQVNSAAQVAPNALAYDHTFSVLQSAKHPTLSIDVKKDDIEHMVYANSVVDSLKLDAKVGDYVKFEVGLKGKKGVASVTTPSQVAENIFLAKHITAGIADTYAGLSSPTAIAVKTLSLDINKNIEDKDLLGLDGPSDFLNKQLVIEGSLEMIFENTTVRDYALNGTQKSMIITMVNSDVTIATSANPKLVIKLAKVKFGEPVESGDNNDFAKVVVKFKAFYSTADSKSIEAILSNLTTSY